MSGNFYEKVYKIAMQIPYGNVTTYGHIALLAGKPNAARAVGYALKAIPVKMLNQIPWHRVINAKACISIKSNPEAAVLQKQLLENEGVIFDKNGKTDFKKYGWFPV